MDTEINNKHGHLYCSNLTWISPILSCIKKWKWRIYCNCCQRMVVACCWINWNKVKKKIFSVLTVQQFYFQLFTVSDIARNYKITRKKYPTGYSVALVTGPLVLVFHGPKFLERKLGWQRLIFYCWKTCFLDHCFFWSLEQ